MGVTRLALGGSLRPTGNYSTLAAADPGQSLIWISGQVGRRDDETFPNSARQQTLIALQNIATTITGIGLELDGLVHLRTYLVGRSAQPEFIAARDEVMGDWFGEAARPASTLLIVPGVADPRAFVEVEAIVAGIPVLPDPN